MKISFIAQLIDFLFLINYYVEMNNSVNIKSVLDFQTFIWKIHNFLHWALRKTAVTC